KESDRAFRLAERQHSQASAQELAAPELLELLGRAPALPRELFGELGFQSSRLVSERLFHRGNEPHASFSYPLLEGRDVAEFREGAPRLFLNPDPELLKLAGCRLKDPAEFRRASFVVRQTAAMPIAALHSG